MVRTTAFQAVNRGSIPRGATNKPQSTRKGVFDLVTKMTPATKEAILYY